MGESSLIRKIMNEGINNISEEDLEEEVFSLYNTNNERGLKNLHDVLINSIFSRDHLFRSFPDVYFAVRADLDLVSYYSDGEYDEELEDDQIGPIQNFYRKTLGYGMDDFDLLGPFNVFRN